MLYLQIYIYKRFYVTIRKKLFSSTTDVIAMAVLVIILPLLIFMSWKLYSLKRRPDGQEPEHLKCENKENRLQV